jgi:hypothetical protein
MQPRSLRAPHPPRASIRQTGTPNLHPCKRAHPLARAERWARRRMTGPSCAGELFGELAATWNDYIAVAEESDKLAGESGIAAGILAVEPAPMSFRSFLLLLHTAATDESVRAEPFEEQLSDIGVFWQERRGW